jgi:replicative DNA helicase
MSDGQRTGDVTDDTPLARDEITALFRGFLRYPSLLQDAMRVRLDNARFDGDELMYLVVYSAARDLLNEYGSVTRDMLVTRIATAIDSGSVVLRTADAVFMFGPEGEDGFIDEAFNTPRPESDEQQQAERRFLEGVLRRFLRVRLIRQNIQRVLNSSTDDTIALQIRQVIDRWGHEAQSVEAIGTPTANSAEMPAFGSPLILPPPLLTTGIPWIDQYTGGIRPGDVMGVLGPYSGGKTTVLTTAVVRLAELYANQGSNKLSVFVGYEDGSERMNAMLWSAAARIDRNLFSSAGANFWAELSTRESLKDYDRNLPENRNGEIVFGERERWENAMHWFNRHCVFLDFSSNTATGGRGAGGVAEIRAALDRLKQERGMDIGFVAVDYAGILVERELGAKGDVSARTEQSALTRPIKQVPDTLRIQVAKALNCTVMLAHQLAPGECKKVQPWQYISHLDASGAKSFAENLHSCMCINMRDISTLVSTIYWSKIRLGLPPCGTPHGLIRMDDNLVDVHLVNDQYVADSASRAILRRGDVRVASPTVERADNTRRAGWGVDSFASDI